MSPACLPRAVLIQYMLACAVCAGAYQLLLQPAQRELALLRAQTLRRLSEGPALAAASRISPAQLDELSRATMQSARTIQARSRVASSEAAAFASIETLARARGVRVEGIAPVLTGPALVSAAPPLVHPETPPEGAAAPPTPGAPPADRQSSFQLEVTGTFIHLSEFISDLSDDLGYTTILDLHISSAGEPQSSNLRAKLRVRNSGFDVSKLLASGESKAATPDGRRAGVDQP